MVELAVVGIFAAALFVCVGLGASVLPALVFGFFLFFGYGLYRGHGAREMLSLAASGVKTVSNILLTFALIGMITALWKIGGTIPYIVYHLASFCSPHAMVLITFLLCSLISFLTGTSAGTAATMGIICVTMANSMGIPILYSGGAVLAGSFFGDRCSPMSTSALLVSTLTGSDLFRNIANMVRTSLVPFAITCVVYALVGMRLAAGSDTSGVQQIFAEHFVLHPAALVPAAVIVVFSLFRMNVRITMTVSIVCGAAAAILIQGVEPAQLVRTAIVGYYPEDPVLRGLLAGGGVLSMVKVFCIVCISSSYAGMFNGTGLLDGIRRMVERISERILPFGAVLLTSVITSLIGCNQTLAIMLTQQLCSSIEPDPEHMAIDLENTAVVIAPMVPWSIAGAVPLSAVGAPMACILTACYLYLLPVCNYVGKILKKK